MKLSPLLLSITLVAPLCAVAAPADKPVTPPVAGHGPDDGHDHGGEAKTGEDGPTDDLWRRSDAAFHAGDFPRAIALHREIVTIDPADFESFGVGAWLMWSMEDKAEADAFIAQGLKANPDSYEMWDTAGQQYGLQKEHARERDAYGKAIKLAGDQADQMLRRRYAHASEHAGDLSGSATVWRGLVGDYPDDVVNQNNLARVQAALDAQNGKVAVKTMGALGLGALVSIGWPLWKKRS